MRCSVWRPKCNMNADDGSFEQDADLADLASAILDRKPVDWHAVESRAGESHRALFGSSGSSRRFLPFIKACHQPLTPSPDLTRAEQQKEPGCPDTGDI